MFSAFNSARSVVTLFHSPTSSASRRALQALKQSAPLLEKARYKLDVTEAAPTADQLKTIVQYLGPEKVSAIVDGASTLREAYSITAQSPDSVLRPIVVDWINGKVVAGPNDEGLKKLISDITK
ncbi:thioredoxin-like protein [Lipomyces arxii]|uniref:thioredoxin-like protein n=1 Tax=Lipomyces arxii TaxID=56418 RepID=UPI0034CD5014